MTRFYTVLSDGVKVAQGSLEPLVQVRILVGQPASSTATPCAGPMPMVFMRPSAGTADECYIAAVDADGAALAESQGLNPKLEAEVKSKGGRIPELEKRLSAIGAL